MVLQRQMNVMALCLVLTSQGGWGAHGGEGHFGGGDGAVNVMTVCPDVPRFVIGFGVSSGDVGSVFSVQ